MSREQVSRIINSPLFAELVERARIDLTEAKERAKLQPRSKAAHEASRSIDRIALLRDYSERPEIQLKASVKLLALAGYKAE